MTIRIVPYKEARLDYFKRKAAKCRKTLWWWQWQKPGKQYDAQTIQDMCSELGREISYLDDVVDVLARKARRRPDPEIGLMPCGCGGVATCYSTPNEIDMAFVACGGCDIRTPDMFPESAVESWNQAMMGWRGEE